MKRKAMDMSWMLEKPLMRVLRQRFRASDEFEVLVLLPYMSLSIRSEMPLDQFATL